MPIFCNVPHKVKYDDCGSNSFEVQQQGEKKGSSSVCRRTGCSTHVSTYKFCVCTLRRTSVVLGIESWTVKRKKPRSPLHVYRSTLFSQTFYGSSE